MNQIMIIDNALDLGRRLRMDLLKYSEDLEIVVIPSAQEALKEASQWRPDLVIADIRYRGMAGLDMVTNLRIHIKGVNVIIITDGKDASLDETAHGMNLQGVFHIPLPASFFEAVMASLEPTGVPASEPASTIPGGASIPDLLAVLRNDLGALSALLFDEQGGVTAADGDLPIVSFDLVWIPQLQAAFAAALRANQLTGGGTEKSECLLSWRGPEYSLLAMPLSKATLFVAIRGMMGVREYNRACTRILEMRPRLIACLRHVMGPLSGPSVPSMPLTQLEEQAERQPEAWPEIIPDTTLSQDKAEPQTATHPEQQVVSPEPEETSSPDTFSYEEALNLGLINDLNDEPPPDTEKVP